MKIIIISLLIIFTIGCENSNQKQKVISQLEERINGLETENKILKDSLEDNQEKFLKSQILIGIPDDQVLKVGKKNNITILFHTYNIEIPEYEIFKFKDGDTIKVGTNNLTSFKYEFIPKDINDSMLDLMVKVPLKNSILEIPASMSLNVEE